MSIHATSTEVYSGKNLYDQTTPQSGTWGITYSGNANFFEVNGNPTGTGGRAFIGTSTLPAGTYTLTLEYLSGEGNINVYGYEGTSWTQPFSSRLDVNSSTRVATKTFTLESQTNVRLAVYTYSGNNCTNLRGRFQIEAGSRSTSFEPYVGGVPSPLISGVTHVSTSKNLLNMQSTSNGEYLGTTSQQTYSGKNILNVSSQYTISSSTIFEIVALTARSGVLYRVSCSNIDTNGSGNCRIGFNNAGGNNVGTVWLSNSAKTQTVTLTGDAVSVYIYSDTNYIASQSATTTYTDLMISEASTTSDYEPYVGGIPSPNPDYPQEIFVGKLASKNIFEASSSPAEVWQGDYTKITANSLKVKSTVNHPSSTAYARVDITGLTPNTDYYFSYNYERTGGSVSGPTVGGVATRIDGGAISSVTIGGRKINTGPGTYIRFYFYVGQNTSITTSDEVTFSNIQLEKGSTATEFEPYFTPIELTQVGNYQDKVYKSGGNWYIYRDLGNYQLTGSENWQKHQASGAFYDRGNSYASHGGLVPANNDTLPNIMSTHFVEGAYSEVFVSPAKDGICVATDNTSNPRIHVEGITTAEDFKTMITAKQPVIYFPLATPTDTAITDSATILWLNKYDTDSLPHHKYINTRRTTYVGASGLASAIDLYDGSYASTLPTYSTANDHHLTTANGGTYTVSLQNISAKIVSGTVTFSVFTNQRKIDFSWNGSATSTSVSVSLQADEYIKSIYAYIPQNADAGITLSQQLESGSLTDFEPYYNIVKIYAGDDLVFEDTSLTD